MSLLVVLENLLRHEDGENVTQDAIASVAERASRWGKNDEILFYPSRVVMQDYAGLVALIDLATMRERVRAAGGDPANVKPVKPVDLVIDHSLIVNHARSSDSAERNIEEEYALNHDRFAFAKWAQLSLPNLRVVPPGNGIIHQVNLEHLAEVVRVDEATGLVHPESQIGTDSHTTMINGLGVLAWGVGGIEAAASMLGEPVSMLVPGCDRREAQRRAAPGRAGHPISFSPSWKSSALKRRGRQIRGILRPRHCGLFGGRPRDLSPTWRRNMAPPAGILPHRREDALLSAAHGPRCGLRSRAWAITRSSQAFGLAMHRAITPMWWRSISPPSAARSRAREAPA